MTDAWRSVKIKRFEHVPAGPTVALLRISGKGSWRRQSSGPRPTLLVACGEVVKRFAALPSPEDPRGLLRSAYSVAEAMITPETVFSLELSDGHVLVLPQPTAGAARVAPAPVVEPDDEPEADDEAPVRAFPPDVDDDSGEPVEGDRRGDLMSKLAALTAALAEAERAAAEHQTARSSAEAAAERVQAEAGAAAAQAEAARAEAEQQAQAAAAEAAQRAETAAAEAEQRAQAAAAEAERREQTARAEGERREQAAREEGERRLQGARADAEQQMRDATVRAERRMTEALDAARATADERVAATERALAERVEAATRRAEDAVLEAAAARESVETLEHRNAELQESVRSHQARIGELEGQLTEALESVEPLKREIESLSVAKERLQRELRDSLDSQRKMTLERDELSRQAAAFDQVAIKARERAAEAESTNERIKSALTELETWRSELERRLAATTTELGAARTKTREDALELRHMRGAMAEAEARAELAQAQVRTLQEQLGGGGGPAAESPEILRSDLERLSAELAALRDAAAQPDAEHRHAGNGTAGDEAPPGPPSAAAPNVGEVTRRALEEARERAARELSDAAADERRRGS